jgi:hypothetical protein
MIEVVVVIQSLVAKSEMGFSGANGHDRVAAEEDATGFSSMHAVTAFPPHDLGSNIPLITF